MSRTHRTAVPNWYAKESKPFRHRHFKAFRAAAKRAVRTDREAPFYRRTSGWLTH
jgi:hypothetical protein